MSYVTDNCAWLSSDFPQDVKDLIAKFYELADSTSPDAGNLMASEVFSNDAILISPNGTFKGFEEISKSRANAWTTVKTRRHLIKKAFSGHAEAQSLVLLGAVRMDLRDGQAIESAFACHLELDKSGPKRRISFMQIYASTAPRE